MKTMGSTVQKPCVNPKKKRNRMEKRIIWLKSSNCGTVTCLHLCLCVGSAWGESPPQVRKFFDTERVSRSDRAQVTDIHYAWERKARLDIKSTLRYSQLHVRFKRAIVHCCLCYYIKQTWTGPEYTQYHSTYICIRGLTKKQHAQHHIPYILKTSHLRYIHIQAWINNRQPAPPHQPASCLPSLRLCRQSEVLKGKSQLPPSVVRASARRVHRRKLAPVIRNYKPDVSSGAVHPAVICPRLPESHREVTPGPLCFCDW